MAVSLVSLSAVLSCLIVSSESAISLGPIATETSPRDQHYHRLTLELEEAKLKIARLESIFDETVQHINAKSLSLEECEKLIAHLTHEMDGLQSALSSLKSSRANERLNQLEGEVQHLWADLRKTNFELHLLESRALDAENNMNLLTSEVEMMAAIVTEQWIQIRQLEQALHNAQVQALTVRRLATRCKFLKFLNLFGNHLQKLKRIFASSLFHKESALCSYLSQALHHLEKISLAAKKNHYEMNNDFALVLGKLAFNLTLNNLNQLQGFIKQEMEKNKFTAALANKEVVFFVASAVITCPIISAWMLLSSRFSELGVAKRWC